MFKLFEWRKPDLWLSIILWAVVTLLPLGSAVLLKFIFDALASRSAGAAWFYLGLLALLSAARQVAFGARFRVLARHIFSLQAALRSNILSHLLLAQGSRVLPGSQAEALSRFRDDVKDLSEYVKSCLDIGSRLIYATGGISVLVWTDPLIALAVCGPSVLNAILLRRLSDRIRRTRTEMREAAAMVNEFILHSVVAIEPVKAGMREGPLTEHFRKLGLERRHKAVSDVLLGQLVQSGGGIVGQLGIAVAMIGAGYRLHAGLLSLGDFAMLLRLAPSVASVLSAGIDTLGQHRRARVAMVRLQQLVGDARIQGRFEVPEYDVTRVASPANPPQRAEDPIESLQVRGLTYRYPGSQAGISDIGFSLVRGQSLAIAGRIGSGKTTVLRVLQGLLPAQAGEIRWNGRLVEDPASFFKPCRSAYTPQTPHLFTDTLKNNVMLGHDGLGTFERALDVAAMQIDMATLDGGADCIVGARGTKLSGGQVHRAAIARMVATGAGLLIFDDVSTSLDAATEMQVWRSLSACGSAWIAVSNRPSVLASATNVLLLSEGRTSAYGPLAELLKTSAEMQALLQGQRC